MNRTNDPKRTFCIVLPQAPGYRGIDSYLSGVMYGIDSVLLENNAQIQLLFTASEEEEIRQLRRLGKESLVDAVILTDLRVGDPRPAICREAYLPVVSLGLPGDESMPCVTVDNMANMRKGLDYLVSEGHKTLAHVTGPQDLSHTRQRINAFRDRCRGLQVKGYVAEGDYSKEAGRTAVLDLLTSHATRPTAIIFDNDLMAVGGLEAAAELSVRVPQDLSILSWDDSPESRLTTPPLSMLSTNFNRIGEICAQALLETSAGRGSQFYQTPGAELLVRGSTGPAPSP